MLSSNLKTLPAGRTILTHLNGNGFLPDFHVEMQWICSGQNYITAVFPILRINKSLFHGALVQAQRCSWDLKNGRQWSKWRQRMLQHSLSSLSVFTPQMHGKAVHCIRCYAKEESNRYFWPSVVWDHNTYAKSPLHHITCLPCAT